MRLCVCTYVCEACLKKNGLKMFCENEKEISRCISRIVRQKRRGADVNVKSGMER